MLLVKRVLQFRGYNLLEAANGTEGLATAEAQPVDLILLDINLPDLDGYEVARRLRSSSKLQLAYIPIIAITANALKGDAEKALEFGMRCLHVQTDQHPGTVGTRGRVCPGHAGAGASPDRGSRPGQQPEPGCFIQSSPRGESGQCPQHIQRQQAGQFSQPGG